MAAGTTIVTDAGDLEVSGDGNITLGNHIFADLVQLNLHFQFETPILNLMILHHYQ